MKDNNIEFRLDFGGFYESMASCTIDGRICDLYRSINDDDSIDSIDDIYDKNDTFMDNIDYEVLYDDYSNQWLEKFNKYFHTYFIYKGVWNPEYYNFETDKIECEISESHIDDIIDYKDVSLVDFIEEISQSCPEGGFYSFYEGWDQVITNKAVFMNYYTRWLCDIDSHIIDNINESLHDEYELPNKIIIKVANYAR